MKIVSSLVTAILLFAGLSVATAHAKCSDLTREFSGEFEAPYSVLEQPSRLVVSVASNRVFVGIGPTPEIGFQSEPTVCSATVISGRFEDNWGNTGKYVLRLGAHPSIELTDLGTPAQMVRNTIGAYPEHRVRLRASK